MMRVCCLDPAAFANELNKLEKVRSNLRAIFGVSGVVRLSVSFPSDVTVIVEVPELPSSGTMCWQIETLMQAAAIAKETGKCIRYSEAQKSVSPGLISRTVF